VSAATPYRAQVFEQESPRDLVDAHSHLLSAQFMARRFRFDGAADEIGKLLAALTDELDRRARTP